jgi:hypothetical protein
MIKGFEVLQYLIPSGGWYISGDEYAGIQFLECEPITQTEFEAGFAQVEKWKTEKETDAVAAKTAAEAKLAALGLTVDDLKALRL